MSFNFPNSPVNGDRFSPVGGPTYIWQSPVWRLVAEPQSLGTAEARNRLVNPCFQIQQDATMASSYVCDEWIAYATPAGITTVWQQDEYGGLIKSIGMAASTAKPSLAATDVIFFQQNIEGVRVSDLSWGLPYAKQLVLRFSLWCGLPGTFTMSLASMSGHVYVDTFVVTQAHTEATKATEYSFVIPPNTVPSYQDTQRAFILTICFACGTTYQTATKGWQAGGNKFAHTSASNGVANANASFYLYSAGLYLDPLKTGVAPPFQMPDEAQELAACQRYYYKSGSVLFGAYTIAGGATYYSLSHVTSMRVGPAVTHAAGYVNASNLAINAASTNATRLSLTITGTGYGFADCELTYNSRM